MNLNIWKNCTLLQSLPSSPSLSSWPLSRSSLISLWSCSWSSTSPLVLLLSFVYLCLTLNYNHSFRKFLVCPSMCNRLVYHNKMVVSFIIPNMKWLFSLARFGNVVRNEWQSRILQIIYKIRYTILVNILILNH